MTRCRCRGGLGLVSFLCLTLAPSLAGAQGLRFFTASKVAVLSDRPGSDRDVAVLRFRGDRELEQLVDPRCPSTSRLEIGVLPARGFGIERVPAFELSCEKWRSTDGGYVYRDRGRDSVIRIDYTTANLRIFVRGRDLAPARGPAAFVQMRFDVGAERFMARFYNFRRNGADAIRTRAPSRAESEGEAAFWDTLWGVAQRDEECIARLEEAVAHDPANGRAYFLLGMIRLYRVGLGFRAPQDWRDPGDSLKAEIALANQAFERAVPLLWDGEKGDSRVPGFAASALYQLAVLNDDSALLERAQGLLEEAVVLNPIFNNFNLFSSFPVVAPDDPLFQRGVAVVEDVFGGPTAGCFFSQPEICANAGLAPHNGEGAMMMFGDIFSKAGLRDRAASAYNLARAIGGAGWLYGDLPPARLASLDQRIELYRNGDPDDDPPLFGFNGNQSCKACHQR